VRPQSYKSIYKNIEKQNLKNYNRNYSERILNMHSEIPNVKNLYKNFQGHIHLVNQIKKRQIHKYSWNLNKSTKIQITDLKFPPIDTKIQAEKKLVKLFMLKRR
jgi:hypothetical protein